jgi:acylpyruvate hydrolase
MRFVSYIKDGTEHLGARVDDTIVDLSAASGGAPTTILDLLEGGPAAMNNARAAAEAGSRNGAAHLASEITLLPVVPRPPKILCIARNYAEHAAEAKLDVLEQPNIFIRYAQSLIADGAPIQVPRVSDQVDWEAELAVIIGTGGKHIAREDALAHVAGYAIFNDVSIRDWQLRKPPIQFGSGKNFDASGPFGPDMVTVDEVGDPQSLSIALTVNGEVMQSSTTAQMIFAVDQLIEFISRYSTLEPGDVIATGTPSGVGNFRQPPVFLKAGDTVRIEIEKVGVQENPVIDEPAS